MSASPTWTPASRPGLIPLHPLSFGTILGRSFTALRQNPRVLLGFALITQTVVYILLLLAIAGVGIASFSRLDTLQPGTDDFDAVIAGSTAVTITVGVVLSLAAGALSVIVQGIVVTEVARAAVAERLSLKALWVQLRPVVWRLIGYSLLLLLAVLVVVAAVVAAIVALAFALPPLAVVLGILLFFAAVPLYLWLAVKLLLVPATIILERARIGEAIGRSWRLTKTRFWSILGIVVIIQIAFGALAQVISFPFSLIAQALVGVIAPTGSADVSAIISGVVVLVLAQILTLLVQAVALVVQATATSLIYIDCRMRHEGLDLDLLDYVERRDAGAGTLADPYRLHVGREIAPRGPLGRFAPSAPPAGYNPPGGYPPAYGAPAYPPPGAAPAYPPHGAPQPPVPQPPVPQPPYAPPSGSVSDPPPNMPPAPAPAAPPAQASDAKAPAPWAAPGSDSADSGSR